MLDHHQLDSASVSGWAVRARKDNDAWSAVSNASKSRAVCAVFLVDHVHGVDFVVQVPGRVRGVPTACWDVSSLAHADARCAAELGGQETGGG